MSQGILATSVIAHKKVIDSKHNYQVFKYLLFIFFNHLQLPVCENSSCVWNFCMLFPPDISKSLKNLSETFKAVTTVFFSWATATSHSNSLSYATKFWTRTVCHRMRHLSLEYFFFKYYSCDNSGSMLFQGWSMTAGLWTILGHNPSGSKSLTQP